MDQERSMMNKLEGRYGESSKVIGKVGKGRAHRRTSEECWELQEEALNMTGLTSRTSCIVASRRKFFLRDANILYSCTSVFLIVSPCPNSHLQHHHW